MRGRLVLDLILARASSLGLTTAAGGAVDAASVELTLLYTLQTLAETFDFDLLTVISDPLLATQTDERQYALPPDFGRLMTPHDDLESGLFLDDGTNEHPLRYRDPITFRQEQTTTSQRPAYFTIVHGPALRLDPPPDSNSNAGYTITGVYIRTVDVSILEEDVPMFQTGCLVDMVLGTLAMDHGHANAALYLQRGEQARGRLINTNARMRQQFQSKTGRLASDTRQRYAVR